jgi:flagellar biosynthesis GTPase FlhF
VQIQQQQQQQSLQQLQQQQQQQQQLLQQQQQQQQLLQQQQQQQQQQRQQQLLQQQQQQQQYQAQLQQPYGVQQYQSAPTTPAPAPQQFSAPAPYAAYQPPAVTFPESSNYATYSSSAFDASPAVLYPNAPRAAAAVPDVDQRAKQEAEDAALAARLQREMMAESGGGGGGGGSSAARSVPSQAAPTYHQSSISNSPSYSYMAPPPSSMMPPRSSGDSDLRARQEAEDAALAARLQAEHFEADVEEPVHGNYGMPAPQPQAPGQVIGAANDKPKPKGLMARLFGPSDAKPPGSAVPQAQMARPPNGYPGAASGYPGSVVSSAPQYVNANAAYAGQAQRYYPQSYPSSNPANN